MTAALRRRLAGEQGISLTVAICSLALMVTMSGVALSAVVSALRQADHQGSVKRALQAADAAVQAAVFRVQRADLANAVNVDPLHPDTIAAQNCVVSNGTVAGGIDLEDLDVSVPADPSGRKWCPATEEEDGGDGATFNYRLSQVLRIGTGPCGQNSALTLDREIVAVGRSGDVRRRIKARMRAALSLLSGAAVQSGSATGAMTLRDTARVLGNVQANAAITATGVNLVAGNATPGPDTVVTGVVPAGSTAAACQPFVLPLVEQGTAPTVNDNALRTDGCVNAVTLLSVPCKPLLVTTGGVDYDAAKRTLRVWGNGRALLNGSTYSFCSIRLENQGMLQVRSTTPTTRVFLDDPDNCRNADGSPIANAGQVTVDGAARIVNCHLQTQPESLQVYAVGSGSLATTQTLQGAGLISGALRATLCGANVPLVGEPMVFYAPRSTVELGGSTALAGQLAGDVVHMSGSSAVQPVNALINIGYLGANPILPLYKPTEYVECTSRTFDELPANDPAQGC